jgi:hypothetical protein
MRRYYSVRHNPKLAAVDLKTLKRLFLATFHDFEQRGYFQECFGYECVDAGPVPGAAGPDPAAFCFRRLRKPNLWPLEQGLESYSEEDLLDMTELLHDCASKPIKGVYHREPYSSNHSDTLSDISSFDSA